MLLCVACVRVVLIVHLVSIRAPLVFMRGAGAAMHAALAVVSVTVVHVVAPFAGVVVVPVLVAVCAV